jgi:hypothetical protein
VTSRRLFALTAAIATAGMLGWLMMAALGRFLRTAPEPVAEPAAEVTTVATPDAGPAAAGPRIKATLFFATEDGRRLRGIESEVPLADDPVAQVRAIVEALLTTAPPAPLASTIPPGTTLRGVYLSRRNEVFVDLDATVRTAHPGGSLQELLTVYSLVNTIVVNLPSITEVQILINGQEADTLAGHMDLRRPLRKNESLVDSPSPTAQAPPS